MSIKFYYAPMSSATPVAWALAELGVPHEAIKFDLKANDQRKPDFLALNPNGKVPTLVVDGTPIFEACAIMQWLGDKYGVEKKVWPAFNDPARLQAMAWTTWSYVTFGGMVGRLFMATTEHLGKEFQNPAQAEYARKEIDGLLEILDTRLKAKPYLLSSEFSIADLIVASTVGWAAMNKVSLERHANVRGWLERCQARPSFKATWAS
jgi:glutathione S-transferase